MKRTVFLLPVILFVFNECQQKTGKSTNEINQSSSKTDLLESTKAPAPLEDSIHMTIEPHLFKPSTVGEAKLLITNRAKDTLTFGDEVAIEHFNGLSWEKLAYFDDVPHYDRLSFIRTGESKELAIHLQPKPYKYTPGKYRVCKDVGYGLIDEPSMKRNTVTLYAEFTVE